MMPRGGARPGAGRKRGDKNKLTKEREAAVQKAAAVVEQALGEPFKGDAHALLMAVCKDTSLPIDTRLDAAKAAIRFEKSPLPPALPKDADGNEAPRDPGDEHFAAMRKVYAGGLKVIEGGQPDTDLGPRVRL